MTAKLIIASNNAGKIKEIAEILGDLPLDCLSLKEAGISQEVVETGDTYAANALLKAIAACREANLPTLGDDSGLEVDALGGRPGLYSARYAGPNAGNAERWAKLLSELKDVEWEKRTARFRCAVALAAPGREPQVVEGACEGIIAFAPRGSGGFGYDPLFFMPDHNCTMAELPKEVKNRVSHRARALQKAKMLLMEWLRE
ncbi:MAG: XTP/dITP diphosphatase [Chloroflexi bacterium]|nr:XTP/dITP diphosphatase [Chloroflexota bacterium]